MVALPSPSRTRAGGRRSGASGTSSRGPRFSGRPSARSSRGRAGAPRRAPRRKHPVLWTLDRRAARRRRPAAGRARRRTRRRVWNSTRTRVGRLCPSPPSPSAGRSPADTGPVPRTCAQINQSVPPTPSSCASWRGGHDLCTAVDVPLTAPRTAGAGDRSNASSENPAARSWRSDAPQKPNISAQSAQNMSSASDSQWQQNVISVCGRELMLKAPAVQFRLINMTMHPESVQNQARQRQAFVDCSVD